MWSGKIINYRGDLLFSDGENTEGSRLYLDYLSYAGDVGKYIVNKTFCHFLQGVGTRIEIDFFFITVLTLTRGKKLILMSNLRVAFVSGVTSPSEVGLVSSSDV